MAANVLVVDDDLWITRLVTTLLERRGHQVRVARDGEQGLAMAFEHPPDVLITDIMMPKMDGWTLVQSLRSRPEFVATQVIFLTAKHAEDDRLFGYRLDCDDYITKPFRLEELDLRVLRALRRSQLAKSETRDQFGAPSLKGDLSQVGLSSLLILIEMERKTGLLTLKAPEEGPSASILVREGRIVHARIEELTEPVDAECVYYLLRWGSGEFEFTSCLVEGSDRIGVTTTHLLMEGARLMDEADAGFAIDGLDGSKAASEQGSAQTPAFDDPDVI